jgi:hypothetical protein
MPPPPQWAQDLAIRVALDEGCDTLPELTWRRSRQATHSSGKAIFDGRVIVTAGKERRDQKLVLLHELAHWLMPDDEHHGPAFWDKVWQLYRRYGVPLRYAKEREGQYRKGALAAYRRNRQERMG